MHIKMDFLIAPGSGRNKEKFYIGIQHDKCAYIIYGAHTPSGAGTVKKHASAASVQKKVAEKARGEYRQVHPSQVSAAAKENALDLLARSFPGFDRASVTWQQDGIVLSSLKGGAAPRPKRSRRTVHAWI